MGSGMIVVDTNVVAAVVIRGATIDDAFAARARDREWIAPRLLASELLNALSKYLVIAKSLDRDDAVKAFRRGLALVEFPADQGDAVDILNVCTRSGLTSYDAEFVALAIERNTRLVTLDNGILNAYPQIAVSLADFAAGK